MNVVAESRPSSALSVTVPCPEQGLAAQDLALGYLRSISACWRGDPGASVFTTRLGAYACSDLPPAPHTPPDAMSPHGGGGRGIHWYHTGNDVLGYVPGGRSGYLVPTDAIPRLVRCAPAGPWTTQQPVAQRSGRAVPHWGSETFRHRVLVTSS
jgi:hypothetical protein